MIAEVASDLSTYRLDDELLAKTLRSKVDKLSTMEAFNASPTLLRILAKEGITSAVGETAELHAGMSKLVQLVRPNRRRGGLPPYHYRSASKSGSGLDIRLSTEGSQPYT